MKAVKTIVSFCLFIVAICATAQAQEVFIVGAPHYSVGEEIVYEETTKFTDGRTEVLQKKTSVTQVTSSETTFLESVYSPLKNAWVGYMSYTFTHDLKKGKMLMPSQGGMIILEVNCDQGMFPLRKGVPISCDISKDGARFNITSTPLYKNKNGTIVMQSNAFGKTHTVEMTPDGKWPLRSSSFLNGSKSM